MYRLIILFGIALVFAPSLFGYEATLAAYVLNIVSGILIMTLAMIEREAGGHENWEYRLGELIGLANIVLPIFLGFSWQQPAFWVSVTLGVILILLDGMAVHESQLLVS